MADSGDAKLRKAEKTASSAGGGFSFFGSSKQDKLEKAAEEFDEAATAYLLERSLAKAGDVYVRAADIRLKQLNEPLDAVASLDNAFKAYRQVSPEQAVGVVERIIGLLKEKRNLRRAASWYETLGKLLEEVGDLPKARDAYVQAGTNYRDENQDSLSSRPFLQAAELSALIEDYDTAKSTFNAVARKAMDNRTLKYSVKEYLFKSGLASLAFQDAPTAKNDFLAFGNIDREFYSTPEYILLDGLLEALTQGDADMFKDKVNLYARTHPFDTWKSTMAGRCEDGIRAAEEDFS